MSFVNSIAFYIARYNVIIKIVFLIGVKKKEFPFIASCVMFLYTVNGWILFGVMQYRQTKKEKIKNSRVLYSENDWALFFLFTTF